ncbi:glycosyltransferase [Candidatus Oscillochloris fontis]|uniref:glycosyltransferase n=1 Tax=Candidatus Oscillochloris fontis TaxID=2496868 RepID=UPI001EE92934|nr:glycosyltransferase family 2 protein [Candidatus Oscillochloris fontis]
MLIHLSQSDQQQPSLPSITVLICTRDRGESINSTIRSILASHYPDFTLLIVDQSRDSRTEQAIATFRADPRLRYIYVGTQGKSRAENSALALINTEIVLLTDDDCEVPPDWITEMVAPFVHYPRVGIVFCNVVAAPHDPQAGWVPVNTAPHSFLIEDLADWQTSDGVNAGIGAGMAIRYAAACAVGGFSPFFGPGSRFRSGDDLEFTLNVLVAGYQIYRTTTVGVIHYGFRTHEQGRHLTRRNLFGIGGIYGQLIRRGHWITIRHYLTVFKVAVLMPALKDLAHRQPPRKLGRAFWLLRGFLEGLRISPLPRTPGSINLHAV